MPVERTSEILKEFSDCSRNTRGNFDTDISSLLEEYLTEAGLRRLAEDECDRFSKFSEAAVVLQHSGVIYGRMVDHLWLVVQNAVRSDEKPEPEAADGNEASEKTPAKRTRRPRERLDFEPIALEEADNIDLRENPEPRPPPSLPKSFMQFEPRVISDDDVQLTDLGGEPIGLFGDFRANWNVDSEYALRDDMDFSGARTAETAASMVSPSDSGHNSDCCLDYIEKCAPSPGIPSDRSIAASTPVPKETAAPTPEAEAGKETIETKTKTAAPPEGSAAAKTPKAPKIKPASTKYDMASGLSGTFRLIKTERLEFAPPSSMFKSVDKRRKHERDSIRKFLVEVNADNLDGIRTQLSNLAKVFRKRSILTWSCMNTYKKFKRDIEFDPIKGFIETDNDTSQNLSNLGKICHNLSIDSCFDDDMDRLSMSSDRNCTEEDDDAADTSCNQTNIFDTTVASTLSRTSLPSSSTEQSDIAKRVEAWHASIRDKLKNVENRNTDVNNFTNGIFSSFDNSKSTLNFSDIVKDKPPEEIPGYFLTALMLANTNNVVLEQPQPLGDFQMKLISSDVDVKIVEGLFKY